MRSVDVPVARWRRFPAIVLAVTAAACGDPAAQVRLVPLACARPAGANQIRVTAYAGSGERTQSLLLDEAIAIADFPADTEQVAVEVKVGGGAIGAIGKSAPLPFAALANGATIPVVMGPPDGFCEIAPMVEPRAQPLVAVAGDGVLVVGGKGAQGPLSTAEYYDRATATWAPVAVPSVLADDGQGFAGTTLAPLPDGRVALIGGPHSAFVVFDPRTRTFSTDPALIAPRLFHAALAIGADEVLVAGGCSTLAGGVCLPRRQMLRYRLSMLGVPDPTTLLPLGGNLRIAAQLFDLGIQLDGRRRYLLAGGSGDPGLADRFALDDEDTTTMAGGRAQAAALDGGAVLAAFSDDASPASGAAVVYPPDAAPVPVARASDLRGVRLIALEDGRVAGFGGDASGGVTLYDPTDDAWATKVATSQDQPGPLTAPSLARLADGTVLVVGGAVSPRAWLYRPSLVGPTSGSVLAAPASGEVGVGVLTASDPSTVTRGGAPAAWVLTAPSDALTARALVGGPRLATGSVTAVVHVRAGGVALIAQQTGPGAAVVAELMPGQAPRLVRLDAGAAVTVCSPPPALAAFDPAAPVQLRLAITTRDARLSLDGRDIVVCDLASGERGAWGLAALGAGAQLAVDSVTVAR